jgi:hypothetical protein
MDDYIQDLSMSMWEQVQHGDFRGVNDNGQPVNFLHWLNKCYGNCFSSAATKQFAADKISRKVHARETRQDEKKPEYDETEEAPRKRSKGWSNESVSDGSRFSPLDPEKNDRLKEIVGRFTRAYPGIAPLLSQGLNIREISKRLSVPYSPLTLALRNLRAEAKEAGITPREMDLVYRKPNKRATKPEAGAEIAEVAVV